MKEYMFMIKIKIRYYDFMPVIYLLSMLLCDGLAQHILIELCTRWDNDLERLMKLTGKQYAMKDNISALMSAEGESEDKISSAYHKHTIGDMLEYFCVGTERQKLVAPKRPDPNMLKPIRDLHLRSLSSQAKSKGVGVSKQKCYLSARLV